MATKKGGVGTTPGERRASRQDPESIKILEMFADIKRDIKDSGKNIESKLTAMKKKIDQSVADLMGQIRELSTKSLELGKTVQDVKIKMQALGDAIRKTQKEVKEMRKDGEKVKAEVAELAKLQEEI